MSQEKTEVELIDLLVHQEELVAQLYALFAEQIPQHRAFWLELAQEENLHAQWLRRLHARTQTGTGHVRSDHLDIESIRAHVEKLQELLIQVKQSPPILVEALLIAKRIEETVCESKYFEIFEGLSEWAEFKQVKYCLDEAIRHHVHSIHDFLEKLGKT